jgi:hypothetical protein
MPRLELETSKVWGSFTNSLHLASTKRYEVLNPCKYRTIRRFWSQTLSLVTVACRYESVSAIGSADTLLPRPPQKDKFGWTIQSYSWYHGNLDYALVHSSRCYTLHAQVWATRLRKIMLTVTADRQWDLANSNSNDTMLNIFAISCNLYTNYNVKKVLRGQCSWAARIQYFILNPHHNSPTIMLRQTVTSESLLALPNTNVHEHSLSSSQVVTCGQTWRSY